MTKIKNRVLYPAGAHVQTKSGDPIKGQEEAWKVGADCGCGIDCCNNNLVLTDKVTGKPVKLYFSNGILNFDIDGVIATVTVE